MKLHEVLDKYRQEAGLSVYAVHKRSGLTYNGLRAIFEGNSNVSYKTLCTLAETLEVDLWRMIKEAE